MIGTNAGTGPVPAFAGTNGIYINPTGNVGIGTTNPQGYLLAVAGAAIATSVTVKTVPNWPDYVFKKNFHLPTLAETATYIDQNHHLPEMPSAAQITKDGLDLGEMNKLLLKKVEELTLYLIEKDKQLNEQQKQLDTQKQHLDIVETQLEKQQEQLNKLEKKLEALTQK